MNSMPGLAFLFGTGLDEWAVLGAIAFLLFGPKRLPEIARTLGRTLEKLRRAADDFREQIAHLDEPAPDARKTEDGVRKDAAQDPQNAKPDVPAPQDPPKPEH